MRSRLGAVAALVLACALVSSCSLLKAPPAPPPSQDPADPVSTGFVRVTGNEYAKRLGNRYFTEEDRGLFVGPHFLLRQQSVGTVRAIGAETADLLGLDRAMRAPDGYEFVVADLAKHPQYRHAVPDGGRQPGTLEGFEYNLSVHVGEASQPLYANLDGGKLLFVVAPIGSRVRLGAADSGRTQYLDLRTGKRVKDSLTDLYPRRELDYPDPTDDEAWSSTGLAKSREGVSTDLRVVSAEVSPFRPSGKWARRGRAWLYVEVQVAASCEDAHCHVFLSKGHFELRTSRGATPEAVGSRLRSTHLGNFGKKAGTETYAFNVKASTKSAKFTIAPDGELRIRGRGKKVRTPGWRLRPDPVTIPLKHD